MKTSSKGIALIKSFEGCRLQAYRDSVGVLTIGYGHTGDVREGQVISQGFAEELLKADLTRFERNVTRYTPFEMNQNQFDALVSFAFNCGAGNLKKLVSGRSKDQVARKILEYNKAGGRVLAGLTRRRQAERALFLSGGNRTLKNGSRGDDVKELQRLLTEEGFPCGVADGIFGKATKKAVIEYQNSKGLVADGIVGEKTWKALGK
jgi:lysozyme